MGLWVRVLRMWVGGVVGGGGVDLMMSCCVVHGCSTVRERGERGSFYRKLEGHEDARPDWLVQLGQNQNPKK